MKDIVHLLFFIVIIFLSGCTNIENKEQNNSMVLEINETELTDNTLSKLPIVKKNIIENTSVKKEEKKKIPLAPIQPTVESYSQLVGLEGDLQLSVKGEVATRVYIDDLLYGNIASNGQLDINLSNPSEDYFETFELMLSNEEGMDSLPYLFTTTFYRESLDSNYTYYIPQNTDASYTFSNSTMICRTYKSIENGVVSLIMPISLDDNASSLEILNTLADIMQGSGFFEGFKNLGIQELNAQQSLVAEYGVSTTQKFSSLNVLKILLANLETGNQYYLYKSLEKLTYKKFNIKVRFLQKYREEAYVSIAVVPNKFALKYQSMINRMINSQNIRRNSTPIYMEEEVLIAKVIEKKEETANFLFVIDDSGSMADYQEAIAQTAKAFGLAVQNVGMHFRVAIMTTGDKEDAFSSLEVDGVIENDIKLFQESLKVGIEGSAVETAIYNMEQALQSKQYGNQENGILTQLDMPKVNEKLSIIILSDEPSSYAERAEKAFKMSNNPMVNRGYRVYLIGSPKTDNALYEEAYFQHNNNDYGLYGDLVKETGGIIQNISNIDSYNGMMNTIVEDVLGDLGYSLRQKNVIESTIYVTINDDIIPYGDVNGWRYVQSSNSILFSGEFIPDEDDTILIRYGYSLE
ncbi:MAG: Cell surface protein [uncultured Sulfurovum sp.]|uniref:Cell surface protein n=1 Tax=uncultured Sulfurovum sp. TaxID=269237 RepID=A0A6S6TFH9_9BACT|nr:MAG: Cell surface protein [uncultured Sulfurovum sp.]